MLTSGDFDLSIGELRVVACHVVEAAEPLLRFVEDPADPRPREAIAAAKLFAGGAPRTNLQRTAALNAHRAAAAAATEVSRLAAQAAGDAASAAYLHPIAKAHQVGHILRADANALRIVEIHAGPEGVHAAMLRAVRRATPALVDILGRYPAAPTGRSRVAQLMAMLDGALRAAR
jgi:hypothetical protein